jgi:hypothetical protein
MTISQVPEKIGGNDRYGQKRVKTINDEIKMTAE